MSAQVDYEYAHGALLDNPNTYQYSSYYGIEFLEAWISHRENVCMGLQVHIKQNIMIDSPNQSVKAFCHTKTILQQILYQIQNEKIIETKKQILLKTLVKKFEVSKRLFNEYNEEFKPVDQFAYYDFDIYLLFAEVIESAYCLTSDFVYLNVLLKIIDTLIAYLKQFSEFQKSRLANLIQQEKKHVLSIALNNKINL